MKRLLLVVSPVLAFVAWQVLVPEGAPSSARSFATGGDAAGPSDATAPDAGREDEDEPYWSEAWTALERGEVERAEELLEEYLAGRPPAAAVYEMLSTLARRDGDAATAVDYAEKAVELEPERSLAHVALTRARRAELMGLNPLKAMLQLGPLKETMARAVELDPRNAEALLDQAYFSLYAPAIAGGDLDVAREMVERLEAVDAAQARALEMQLLAREERLDAALDLGRAALEEHPASQVVHLTLGMMLLEAEDLPAAEEAFRAAHEGPSLASRYAADYQLAKLLLEAGRGHAEAAELLEGYLDGRRRADVLMPAAGARWRLGQAYEGLGRTEDARAAYEEALRLDGDLDEAREALEALEAGA